MARIYNKTDYGSNFTGSARGGSFNPVKAVDESKKIKEETKRKLDDIQTLKTGLQRQAGVDSAYAQAGQAAVKARMTAIQGLISLSGQAVKTFGAMQQQKAEQAMLDQIDADLLGDINLPEVETTEAIETAREVQQDTNVKIQASEVAINEIGGSDEVLKDSIRQEQTKLIEDINVKKQSVYQASIGLAGWMNDFMGSDKEFVTADGRTITPATIESQADKEFLITQGIRSWAKEVGYADMDKTERHKLVVPQIKAVRSQISQQVGAQLTKARQDQAITSATDTANQAIDAGNDTQTIYNDLSTQYLASGKYRGNKGGSADDAFTHLVTRAIETGDEELLDNLGKVERVPGNKGTVFSKTKEAELADAHIKLAAKENQNYAAIKANSKIDIENIEKTRLDALGAEDADDAKINAAAIAALEEIPTLEAKQQVAKLQNLGLNYNPNTIGQLKAQRADGATFSNEELTTLVKNQDITKQEAQSLGWRDNGVSADSAIQIKLKEMGGDKQVKGVAQGLVNTIFKVNSGGGPTEIALARQTHGVGITQDLTDRISTDIQKWLGDNPDATDAEIRTKIQDIGKIYREEISGVEFDYNSNSFKGYTYGGPSNVTPQFNSAGESILNVTTLDAVELDTRLSEGNIQVDRDIILTKSEMVELKTSITDGRGGLSKPTARKLAMLQDRLGTDAKTIFKSQLEAWDATPVEVAEATGDPIVVTPEMAANYSSEDLSAVAHKALGYKMTPRQINRPGNEIQKEKIIQYILTNQ
tara:strand:- start:5794 stop:8079 length:2286 start_codon:yes stop_codon:yes gene_type:complete